MSVTWEEMKNCKHCLCLESVREKRRRITDIVRHFVSLGSAREKHEKKKLNYEVHVAGLDQN